MCDHPVAVLCENCVNYTVQYGDEEDEPFLQIERRNLWRQCECVLLIIFLLAVFIGIVIGSYLLLTEGHEIRKTYNQISRQAWRAHVPSSTIPNLKLPPTSVLLLRSSGSNCQDESRCSQLVLDLQLKHMKKEPDILFNFIITSDGSIFEGRGWKFQAGGSYPKDAVTIAFLGRSLTAKQIASMKLFRDVAVMDDNLKSCNEVRVWGEDVLLIDLALEIQDCDIFTK